ncbi:hypothetical protein L7F22_065254 [Adiantum nelumboides]|nr:hypothetical protein [Adiantum nelumboides]
MFLGSNEIISSSFAAIWRSSPVEAHAVETLQRPHHRAFQSFEAFMEVRSVNASRLIIVDQFGFGHFQTIQAAVDSIPFNNTHFYTILVTGGIYDLWCCILISVFEFLPDSASVNFNFIMEQRETTFAAFNDPNSRPGRPLGTFHSATVAVNAPNFIARGMTFQNTAPAPANGSSGGQAVALQVSGDQVAFYNCSFRGRQDTLYDHKGRHYFRNCYIEGSVDFIFGDGLSLYKACQIHAVGSGFITAQKRQNASEDTGFSFVDCQVTGSNTSIELYLGRAWGPFSRVVYASCYMDAIIAPQGWHNWGDKSRELTVSYSEFNCSGPGARTSKRVIWSRQLDFSEASPFVNVSFVQGDKWLPYG